MSMFKFNIIDESKLDLMTGGLDTLIDNPNMFGVGRGYGTNVPMWIVLDALSSSSELPTIQLNPVYDTEGLDTWHNPYKETLPTTQMDINFLLKPESLPPNTVVIEVDSFGGYTQSKLGETKNVKNTGHRDNCVTRDIPFRTNVLYAALKQCTQ